MTKLSQSRKTQRCRGGEPKSRKSKSTKSVTAKNEKSASPKSPGSPERCGICLEGMSNTRLTKKTKCGHRFHKECLLMWCDSQKQKGFDTKCPFCNQSIEKDCAALEPGQPMPDRRIRDILRDEDLEALLANNDGQRVAELREKKQMVLERLRFPPHYKYDNWEKITNFDLAKRASMNLEKVGLELGLEL
jgi:hypothetical protein